MNLYVSKGIFFTKSSMKLFNGVCKFLSWFINVILMLLMLCYTFSNISLPLYKFQKFHINSRVLQHQHFSHVETSHTDLYHYMYINSHMFLVFRVSRLNQDSYIFVLLCVGSRLWCWCMRKGHWIFHKFPKILWRILNLRIWGQKKLYSS